MSFFRHSLLLVLGLLIQQTSYCQGYHKDIFVDAGCHLSQRTKLWSADSLGLSYEFMTTQDSLVQREKVVGSPADNNGTLLYPDGSPRFRLLYTHGGKATAHGQTLGEEGRNRVRAFYKNGGSYMGSCAGAFIASRSASSNSIPKEYYGLFPGRTRLTTLYDKKTGHFIEENSALLRYHNFGDDQHIDSIYHWGGCYLRPEYTAGAEILLRFDYPDNEDMHNQISCWSYKDTDQSGRLVVIGSHPEHETSGDGLLLAKAMMQYALSDQEHISFKGKIENNQTVSMSQETTDNNPQRTKIGDQQFHHFAIDVPANTPKVTFTLRSNSRFEFTLYADHNLIVDPTEADHRSEKGKQEVQLTVNNPAQGTLNLAIQCNTKVYMTQKGKLLTYTGNTDLLNGAPYSITANW